MLFSTVFLANLFSYDEEKFQEKSIQSVFIDSREHVNNGLFIPIVGERFDGHDFAQEAVENGAIAMLWQKSKQLPDDISEDVMIFFTSDTTKALQLLAHEYRKKIDPTVIAITGSNGKTTTKDLIASIVQSTYQTHYTDGNFNNHIGLPLTILAMQRDTEVLVLEMGMNNFGEIDMLSKIAQPDYAIITNIGESHIEFLKTRKGIAKAKLEILNGLKENGIIIVDGDDEYLKEIHDHPGVITCGFSASNHVVICDVFISQRRSIFRLKDGYTYTIPLLGKHHAKNATYAITIGEQLNIESSVMQKHLKNLQITSMRFEFLTGKNDVTIINDAYNASPTSMIGAIDVIKAIEDFSNRVLVLGDIFELGTHSKKYHEFVGKAIHPPIDTVYTYGKEAEIISDTVLRNYSYEIDCQHFTSKEQLISVLKRHLNPETIILFKASRGMHFEQIIQALL